MAASLLLLARHISPPTVADAELLERFTRTRDNDAFTELVRRHGPVVYRICQRLVGTAAADDAFQATFLLLATRTSAAMTAHSVGGWLVGVAGRVARQIRRAKQRRQNHETKAATPHPVEPADSAPELLDQFRILDEELTRLPDRLRDPLVSCLLQGHTQEQAAAASGQTTRTVRRRLDEAKRLLRVRLQRRGVTPAVATGLVAGLASVSAAIPTGLELKAVAVVFDFLNGGPELASPPVLLAKGVASNMFARKVMVSMIAMALGLTSLGFGLAQEPMPIPPAITAQTLVPHPQPSSKPSQNPDYQALNLDEKQFLIEAMCVELPAKFSEESGLREDTPVLRDEKTGLFITCLNPREVKMLQALIRTNPAREGITRRTLAIRDGETGSIDTGSFYSVSTHNAKNSFYAAPTDFPKTPPEGVQTRTVTKIPIGMELTVTPKINKDNGEILLRIYAQSTQVANSGTAPEPLNFLEQYYKKEFDTGSALPKESSGSQTAPAIDTRSLQTTLMLRFGDTVIVGSKSGLSSKQTEVLWILTAHLVQRKP